MKTLIKKITRACGIDIRRYRGDNSDIAKLLKLFKYHSVDLVLDVGASDGVSGKMLRDHGYRGKIISFEPLSLAHEKLSRVANDDPLWTVAPRMAIGEENGYSVINVSGSSTSSSILGILPRHLASAPEAAYVSQEKIPIRTLDSLWGSIILSDYKSMFLKIDVQGYEDRVLRGAEKTLKEARGIQIEMSLVPLYDGQMLFDALYERIKEYGFGLQGLFHVYSEAESGRMLQFDGIFFK